jgi:hypothetical protein
MRRSDWDEGGALKFAKEYRDPWMVDEWSNDKEDEKKTIQINTKTEEKSNKEPLPGITFLTETFANNKPYTPTIQFDLGKSQKTIPIDTSNPIKTEFIELLHKGTPINTSRPRFRLEMKQSLKVEIDGVPDKDDKHNNNDYSQKHISEKVASLSLSPRAGAVLINPVTNNTNINTATTFRAVAPSVQVPSSLRNKVSSSYKMNRHLKYDHTLLNNSHNIENKTEQMKETLTKMRADINNRLAIMKNDEYSIEKNNTIITTVEHQQQQQQQDKQEDKQDNFIENITPVGIND